LNADYVDGLHAAEIIARAPGKGGGGGSGSGSGDATSIKGKTVDDAAIGDQKVLTYDLGSDTIVYSTPAGSGDMTKAEYAAVEAGKVDLARNSEKLNSHTEAQVQDHAPKAHANEAHSTQMATSTELTSHTGAAAPHSGHEQTANKDQANGYAGLSASTKVAASQMPTGKIYTLFTFCVEGTLTTGINKTFEIVCGPGTFSIVKAKAHVKTAPTGQSIYVDVNKGGTTIFTTQTKRPQIAAGTTDDDSDTPDITTLAEGNVLSIDIDQVGSGTAGADLTLELVCEQTVAFT
jgi:hypothetical protein